MNAKGNVWFLTTRLTFPKNKDEWVRQEPFTGSVKRWIHKHLANLPDLQRATLIKGKELSGKDHNGVWVRLQVLDHQVEENWGKRNPLAK
jgi:hypothetical protein